MEKFHVLSLFCRRKMQQQARWYSCVELYDGNLHPACILVELGHTCGLCYGHETYWSGSVCVTVGSFQKGKHSSQSGMIPGSWQYKMKLQLILKSSKAYYVLSDAAMILQKYGRALRYIKLALQCHGKLVCHQCCWLYIPFTILNTSLHDLA